MTPVLRRLSSAGALALLACALPFDPAAAAGTGLSWSTYLGGTDADGITAAVADPSGDVILVGFSASADYPTTAGAFQRTKGAGNDVVVTRVHGNGTLAWSTYLGGNGADVARAVALETDGSIVIVGETISTDFPVTPGAFHNQTGMAGTYDAFVARLSADGQRLLASTYLGGSSSDYARAVAVDGSGHIVVAGYTGSTNFPTTPNTVRPVRSPSLFDAADGFVTALDAACTSPVFSTYLGSDGGTDMVYELALDQGRPVVAGWTASSGFPVTSGAFDRSYGGVKDAFVTGLSADGGAFRFSTFVGGGALDEAHGLALDASGNAVVAGYTASTDLPVTPGVVQPAWGGGTNVYDGFVAAITPTGALGFCTYLGGSGSDAAYGLAIASGAIVVTGTSTSSDLPVTPDAFEPRYSGGAADAFVTVLGSDARSRRYASYLGSGGNDQGQGLALRANGQAVLAGSSDGPNFPMLAGFDQVYSGGTGGDGYASCLEVGLGGTTGVAGGDATTALAAPWPNPFRGHTDVALTLERDAPVQMGVYDVSGRLIRGLADGVAPAGVTRWSWNGRDAEGRTVPAGTYFVRVRTPSALLSRPVTRVR